MTRIDGLSQLPLIFPNGKVTKEQIIALDRFGAENINWNIPVMACFILIIAECIRTVPGEIRMWGRIQKRRKLNLAEIFFLLTKYLALIQCCFKIVVVSTYLPKSDYECRAYSWTQSTLMFTCSSLVFCTIAWRTLIIFRHSPLAKGLLAAGLLGQFLISQLTNAKVFKLDKYGMAGMCTGSVSPKLQHESPLQTYTFWFILYCMILDLAMVASACWKLYNGARGPNGFARISRLLFVNNVHYAIAVETVNLAELVILLGWRNETPPLHDLSMTVQILFGMQLLLSEQEAVNTNGNTSTSNSSSYNNPSRGFNQFSTGFTRSCPDDHNEKITIKFEEETIKVVAEEDKPMSGIGIGAIRKAMSSNVDVPSSHHSSSPSSSSFDKYTADHHPFASASRV